MQYAVCLRQVRMLQQKLAGLGQPTVMMPTGMFGTDALQSAASASTTSRPVSSADGYRQGARLWRPCLPSCVSRPCWRPQASRFACQTDGGLLRAGGSDHVPSPPPTESLLNLHQVPRDVLVATLEKVCHRLLAKRHLIHAFATVLFAVCPWAG